MYLPCEERFGAVFQIALFFLLCKEWSLNDCTGIMLYMSQVESQCLHVMTKLEGRGDSKATLSDNDGRDTTSSDTDEKTTKVWLLCRRKWTSNKQNNIKFKSKKNTFWNTRRNMRGCDFMLCCEVGDVQCLK